MSDRLALITGGHRRLGAVIAARLAEAGYAVAIHGSHDAEVDDTVLAALERGGDWYGFVADFLDPQAVAGLMGEVTAHFGRVPDLLVNNASLFGQDALADTDAAAMQAHYAVNCVAPALLTQAFAAAEGAGDRSIVNILDQRIDHPHGDQFAYTLSKMALAGLTQMTARCLAPHIRVNGVAPGLTIATEDYGAAQMERLAGRMPLDRLSTSDRIADAVVYLAGAQATTGQVLYVDGGAHMVAFDRDFMHLDR